MTRHISATDTTKLIRAALKQAYPATRFSVRTDHGQTSAAAWITWTDGPIQDDVEKIVKPFESSTFDPMADIKGSRNGQLNGETVCFGTDYVFCDREQSESLVAAVAAPALRTEVRHALAPEPGGCRWCGTGQRQHASRFAPSVGQHVFYAPTAAQRLARMRARRTSRS